MSEEIFTEPGDMLTAEEKFRLGKGRYDAERTYRPRGKEFYKRKRSGGQFVAVDSEGLNVGPVFVRGDSKYQNQRTFLWMAGGAEWFQDEILCDVMGLKSKQICDFFSLAPT